MGNGPFWTKSWPGAFWTQILAIWRLPGRQLKPPSETIGKRPVLGQILAGTRLEPNFRNLAASGPQLKPPSGTIGKRPVLGQILAGSLLEPDFGNLAASGSLWEASGKPLANSRETAVPLRQARGGQRTPRHKRFSKQDFPSRTRRAGRPFWSL